MRCGKTSSSSSCVGCNFLDRKISKLARENSIPLHLDGARLWNACVATHRPVSDYGSLFDSMSLCFSKGKIICI